MIYGPEPVRGLSGGSSLAIGLGKGGFAPAVAPAFLWVTRAGGQLMPSWGVETIDARILRSLFGD